LLQPENFVNPQNPPEQVQLQLDGYKATLAMFLVISSFSNFEAYIDNLMSEIFDLHVAPDEFTDLSRKRATRHVTNPSKEILTSKRKLQEPAKAHLTQKYKKHSAILSRHGFRFPSELFSPYGIQCAIRAKGNLKSVNIPTFLKEAFH